MSIHLGKTLRDRITGFKGVATGYVKYISGCNQYLIAPPLGKDGKLAESHWFDEQRLEVVGSKTLVLDNSKGAGFDVPAPIR